MKNTVKQYLPPIILTLLSKLRNHINQYRKVSTKNYDEELIAKVIIEKNYIFRKKLNSDNALDFNFLRTFLGISLTSIQSNSTVLKVLDFGGGGGYHYYIARKILDKKIELKWHIVETKSIVKLSDKLRNNELIFFDNLTDAVMDIDQFDLIFASSSLQYCSNQFEIVDQFLKIAPRHIFITRTPFTSKEPLLGHIQYSKLSSNGPGNLPDQFRDTLVSYPIYIQNKSEFEKKFEGKYKLRFILKEECGEFVINGNIYDNYGYFFEK